MGLDSTNIRAKTIVLLAVLSAGVHSGLASQPWAASRLASNERLPEQLWTYRENDGVVPPNTGIIFCILPSRDDHGVNKLVVFDEVEMSLTKLMELSTGKGDALISDPAVLHVGKAPSRDIAFHRMDIDGDKIDEVLLTGRGGAGGTSFLSVFKLEREKVTLLFSDSSRFGFCFYDAEPDGRFELASPGFDWITDDSHILREREFVIYRLAGGKYAESETLSPESMKEIVAKSSERRGVPLAPRGGTSVLRVFDSKKK